MLLVDETSIRKRHRYVTVIVNADTGRTLAMIPHRNTAALSVFGARQGHRWCKGVKVVVSDGSKAYKAAIDVRLGHARHVLDRFHVIRWFSAGLVAVRRDVQRRTPPGGPPTAASTEPTTCSKSCAAAPMASPTTPTSKPAASS